MPRSLKTETRQIHARVLLPDGKKTRDLQREKDRVERLLLNIMPESVYEEKKEYGTVSP
jgi:hypothetical protein